MPVLIQGEGGVGKELIARAIHHYSARCDKSFVSINCMAVPEQLLADELFGHERGGYIGANSQKRGKIDLADGGTLFLDEIQELSLKSQGELLRIIVDQSFERCGGARLISVNVRVVAATSCELEQVVRDGLFREDLYQQLQVVPLTLSPLRERREDIPQLVTHFVRQFHRREGWEPKSFDDSALACLQSYDWPGNIRELKNIVERILIMSVGPVVSSEDLPELLPGRSHQVSGVTNVLSDVDGESMHSLRTARERFERDFILQSLNRYDWNLDKCAETMHVERTALQRKVVQYGLTPKTDR
jgi:two-component system nitrogen regulation response regulator NtrX